MAERAEPVPTRAGWPLLPVLKRVAAMPLKDPFASSTRQGMKFMAGEPMKPATKRVRGL